MQIVTLLDDRERMRRSLGSRIQEGNYLPPSEVAQIVGFDEQFRTRLLELLEKRAADSSFSTTDLSRELNLSRVHLYRKTKELFGTGSFGIDPELPAEQGARPAGAAAMDRQRNHLPHRIHLALLLQQVFQGPLRQNSFRIYRGIERFRSRAAKGPSIWEGPLISCRLHGLRHMLPGNRSATK